MLPVIWLTPCFGEYGLVIVDADDTRLKQVFAPIMEQDIIEQNSFKNISNSNTALQKLGVHIQVNPREINFFYLLDGLRERIVFEHSHYEVLTPILNLPKPNSAPKYSNIPKGLAPTW